MSLNLLKVLIYLVATLGLYRITSISLNRILQPDTSLEILIAKICFVLILFLITLTFISPSFISPSRWYLILLFTTIIASLIFPTHLYLKKERRIQDNKERISSIHNNFFELRKMMEADLNERIKNKNSFNFDEALQFLVQLKKWNLTYQTPNNYMPQAKELLKKAIQNQILDPNQLDQKSSPLYATFFLPRFKLAKTANVKMDSEDIIIFETLLENGANLFLKDSEGNYYKNLIEQSK